MLDTLEIIHQSVGEVSFVAFDIQEIIVSIFRFGFGLNEKQRWFQPFFLLGASRF